MNTKYIICNRAGEYLSRYGGWSNCRDKARTFSKGSVIVCVRQFRKMGFSFYYDYCYEY